MPINYDHPSKNFRRRIRFLVLHYTAVPLWTTLGIFTNDPELAKRDRESFTDPNTNFNSMCSSEVSAHLVIAEDGKTFGVVDEEYAAFHAGISYWAGQRNINDQSIGIENVNLGYQTAELKFPDNRGVKVAGSENIWCQFAEEQIAALIEHCKTIIKKYNLSPYNIIGHSDIACDRKSDPGPLFPWQRLAEAGIGLWYDVTESKINEQNLPADPITWAQERLAFYGYDCDKTGVIDTKTKNVIKAFRMHFLQHDISPQLDLEFMQALDSLCQRKTNLMLQEKQAKDALIANKIIIPNKVRAKL